MGAPNAHHRFDKDAQEIRSMYRQMFDEEKKSLKKMPEYHVPAL